MLTLLLALAASGLEVRSETACPGTADVVRELTRHRPRGELQPGWVRVANPGGTLFVVLHADDGREVAAERVRGATCAELAAESARLIERWESPEKAPLLLAEERVEREDYGPFLRVVGGLIGASFGAVVPLLASLAVPQTSRRFVLLTLEATLGAPLTGLTALVGHYLARGRGNYGAAVGGAALGIATALLPMALAGPRDWAAPYEPATMVLAGVLAVGTPALFLELSHQREHDRLAAAVVPVNGGAGVSVGGMF